jgi:hypothetical protein
MRGFFELRTPGDLRCKLNVEYSRLRHAPTDSYTAFNFFVTAEHMLDWLYPGNANADRRKQEIDSEPLLAVCSHLANGAKHFLLERSRHVSVLATNQGGTYFGRGYFGPSYFGSRYFGRGRLVVSLDGTARSRFGATMPVLDLAEQVTRFWNSHPSVPPS